MHHNTSSLEIDDLQLTAKKLPRKVWLYASTKEEGRKAGTRREGTREQTLGDGFTRSPKREGLSEEKKVCNNKVIC